MAKSKQVKPKLVNVVWSIDGSYTPINTTVRELLKLMVAQHPNKNVTVSRIYSNFKHIGGLVCNPRANEAVTILYYDSRIPSMSPLPIGNEYIEVVFKIEDKPAN